MRFRRDANAGDGWARDRAKGAKGARIRVGDFCFIQTRARSGARAIGGDPRRRAERAASLARSRAAGSLAAHRGARDFGWMMADEGGVDLTNRDSTRRK